MRAHANGIEIAYDIAGPEGAPVVLLHHTLATNKSMWSSAIRSLSDRYRVVAMDARGHGDSEVTNPPYDFATLARDITSLLDALGIAKAHFMGSSMGGMVGQCVGFMAPDRLNSLILVATTSAVPEEAQTAWNERLDAVRAGGMESQVTTTMERWFTAPFIASGNAALAETESMIRNTPADGFIGWGSAIRDFDISDRLSEINCPTLVVVGKDDPSTPVAAAEAIHAGIGGSELVVVPEASHQLPLERPEAFEAPIADFLSKV